MFDLFSLLLVLAAVGLLISLIVIDLRTLLLPNILVLGVAVCGFAFHAVTLFYYDSLLTLFLGAVMGGGLLYILRAAGNYFYKADTLGLGDVKLMAAGGIWLGADFIMLALALGAMAGIMHGVGLMGYAWCKTREKVALSTFSLPAGPGFAVGIFIAALAKFWGLPHLSF